MLEREFNFKMKYFDELKRSMEFLGGKKNTLFIGALLLMGKLSLASSLFIDLQEKNNTTYLITLNGNKTYQTSNDLTINHLNEGNTHLVIEEKTRFNF